MRKAFAAAMQEIGRADERVIFLTGDLGYLALEGVRDVLGQRFINAGVAEQNMISVAASLAYKGFVPWVYSITPFALIRTLEQIRNDVCLHKLPVKIVGNGGGFGYGIMGATHHAPEDIALMRSMPGMRTYLPIFASDVKDAALQMQEGNGPSYLRLNAPTPGTAPVPLRPWRLLREGDEVVLIVAGAITAAVLEVLEAMPPRVAQVYAVGEMPCEIPDEILDRISTIGVLSTIEEHYTAGGLGECLSRQLLGRVTRPIRYLPLSASGYPSGRYGSQRWHQEENGLAGGPLRAKLLDFLGANRGS